MVLYYGVHMSQMIYCVAIDLDNNKFIFQKMDLGK